MLRFILSIVELLILGRVLGELFKADPNGRLMRLLRKTTEPVLELIRPLARKIPVPFDLSPALALIAIELLKWLLRLL